MPFNSNSFMQPVIDFGKWYEVDTTHGISFIPYEVVGDLEKKDGKYTEDAKEDLLDYLECFKTEDIYSIEVKEGFGAKMSASGYMDCTEWSVFSTEKEAIDYLEEYYGDEEQEPEDEDEDS